MSELKNKCKYECEDTGWECPYEALENSKEGFCIFHDKREDKDIGKFNEGIRKILQDQESDAYHFEGFCFPGNKSRFVEVEFEKDVRKDVHFEDAEFRGEITRFVGVRFRGSNSSFWKTKFRAKWTSFSGVEFLGRNTEFGLAQFSGRNSRFGDVTFSGENTVFSGSEFSGETVSFNDVRFSAKNVRFSGVQFLCKNTDFSKLKFSGSGENIDFTNTRFLGEKVLFDDCKLERKIDFSNAIVQATTRLSNLDLRECILEGVDLKNVEFSLTDWSWKHKLGDEALLEQRLKRISPEEWRSPGNLSYTKVGEIYRQLKVHFHNKRDFAKAGMFHFREQECKGMAYELPKDFFEWALLRILRWTCGYGEKLWKVIASSGELIVAFAIIYMWLFGLYTNDQDESLVFQYKIGFENTTPIWTIIKDFFATLSFSVKGFFPLWSFQQYKVVGDPANLVAGIEFLLGTFMVGLFVYVFRRRMEK